MAVETAADLAAFFNPDEFGVVAQIDGLEPLVNGIFETPYLETLPEEGFAGVATRSPQFRFAEADAPRIEEGSTLRIGDQASDGTIVWRAEAYKVAGPVQPDGTGVVVAPLHKSQ